MPARPAPPGAAALLRQYGLRPDKSLGQNFLEDPEALDAICAAADVRKSDAVLEIGAGLGTLTGRLAQRAREVIAIELDRRLFPVLEAVLAPSTNVRLIQGDILKLAPAEWIDQPDYLVVANIPYYITSAVMRHLLEAKPRPRRIVLTVQREVAERICAEPGDLSLLALSVQVYGVPEVTAHIPASAFFPAPKVDSAVLRVEMYPAPLIPADKLNVFFRLAKAGFSQKRKTLRNALSAGLAISPIEAEKLLGAAGIDSRRRAETLDLGEWQRLTQEK